MSELKPCPLCGDKATRAGGYAACDSCSAWAQVEDWNQRHPTAWCACGDSHTSESVCVNCLMVEDTKTEGMVIEVDGLRVGENMVREYLEVKRLAERFVNAKGRYHSQIAMCDLMNHFGKPCVRPEKSKEA